MHRFFDIIKHIYKVNFSLSGTWNIKSENISAEEVNMVFDSKDAGCGEIR